MKYFLDTEFLEGTQKKWFGQTKPTIDLISIGIVAEDGREYYAISKDFNLKEAWNRYDIKKEWYSIDESNQSTRDIKVYWIRENILKPIYEELISLEFKIDMLAYNEYPFSYLSMKYLLNKYGKSNKQIAEEVYEFCSNDYHKGNGLTFQQRKEYPLYDNFKPEFYGYYSDYDWVVFCWLFGKMNDLPSGFPMYCNDLKQELDNKANNLNWLYLRDTWNNSRMSIYTIGKGDSQKKDRLATLEEKLKRIKELDEYPKQTNEHNALADARWNFELYKFLNKL